MSGSIIKKAPPGNSDTLASRFAELHTGFRRRLAGLVASASLSIVPLRRAPTPFQHALLAPDLLPPAQDDTGFRRQRLQSVTINAARTSQRMEIQSRVESFSVRETAEATVFSIRLEQGRQIEIHLEPGTIQSAYLVQPGNSIHSVDLSDLGQYLNGELLNAFSLSAAGKDDGSVPPHTPSMIDKIIFERADGVTLVVCVRPGGIKKLES